MRGEAAKYGIPSNKVMKWVDGELGLILPSKSGVVWMAQTAGVACNHIGIEGTYFDIQMNDVARRCLDLILKENDKGHILHFDDALWQRTIEVLGFEVTPISRPPEGVHEYTQEMWGGSQEAWQWVIVNHVEADHETSLDDLGALIGRTCVLVYQNSD